MSHALPAFCLPIEPDESYPALLLQFLIDALLKCAEVPVASAEEKSPSVFEWVHPPHPHARLRTYLRALTTHFPHLPPLPVSLPLSELIARLEPFLRECAEDENLFLFLLQNRIGIDRLMHPGYLAQFLSTLDPEGLAHLTERCCDHYHRRGFALQITECNLLLSELLHDAAAATTHR